MWSLFIIMVVGGLAAYFILGYALRPLSVLSERISSLSAHQLDNRITDLQAGGEINKVVEAFNQLLERLQRVFESQKRFAGAAAHELKTPLAIIKTNLDVLHLLPEPSTADYQQTLGVAEDQTARMISLVDDLLAISNEGSYEMTDHLLLIDLMREIVAELEPAIAARQLHVSLEGESSCPLYCNAVMLHRALANLLENAIKYNRTEGHIQITVWQEAYKHLVRIDDTGIGIPLEATGQIFEPFSALTLHAPAKLPAPVWG